jgi:hypothetical protein
MSNSNKPSRNFIPIPIPASPAPENLARIGKARKAEVTAEMKALDNAPIAAVKADNRVDTTLPATITPNPGGTPEYNLHEDGSLFKFAPHPKPERAPNCLIVDGAMRVAAVADNAEVADLICNAVNHLHLAATLKAAQERETELEAGGKLLGDGTAPLIVLPEGGAK